MLILFFVPQFPIWKMETIFPYFIGGEIAEKSSRASRDVHLYIFWSLCCCTLLMQLELLPAVKLHTLYSQIRAIIT